jgi:hypothetical protein
MMKNWRSTSSSKLSISIISALFAILKKEENNLVFNEVVYTSKRNMLRKHGLITQDLLLLQTLGQSQCQYCVGRSC